jgi:hypothetical protein
MTPADRDRAALLARLLAESKITVNDAREIAATIADLRAAPLNVERLGEAFTAAWGWSPTHAWQQAERVAHEYAALAAQEAD